MRSAAAYFSVIVHKKKKISLVLQLLKFSQLAAIPNEKRRKPTLTTPVSAFSRLGYINVRLI